MSKLTPEEEIERCFQYFFPDKFREFIKDTVPIFDLFYMHDDGQDDWVEKEVGEENKHTVRAIRTVYLMSKLAEKHAGLLCALKSAHPKLWLRMRKLCGQDEDFET